MDTLINNCSNNTTSQQPIQPQINLLTRHHSQTQLLKRESSPLSSSSSNSNISATELINNNNNNNNNNSNSNNSTNLLNAKPTEWPALDEFIIELLSKPAERLFLLKLEQDLIQFVKNHQMYRLDLPGMNSYQRLMIHKVAPYFNLSHFYDPARQAIFLCKNPYTDV
ncbi:single-stranded nucleic acid binding R3H [Cunninghamella echinulata]|nr:single-stranded nucleic acid binding R3H [Cunninghamella echinulata]